MIIPPFEAQLAGQNGKFPTSNLDDYAFEEKMDGMRGLVVFDTDEHGNQRLQLWNRHGENKGRLAAQTVLREELEAMGKAIPKLYEGTVLDGELIADSWNATMHLAAMSGVHDGDGRLNFVVFDLVYLMGKNLKDQAWSTRRTLLEKVLTPFTNQTSMLVLSALLPPTENELKRIWSEGGEGIIIKQRSAPYEPGGRHYWSKMKFEATAEAIISGYTPGQGKYSDTIGAVELSQYVNGKLQKVTQVSGMTDEVRRSLTDDNIGDVIEFLHFGKTVNTSYRHPQFKRFRPDKAPQDCTWESS